MACIPVFAVQTEDDFVGLLAWLDFEALATTSLAIVRGTRAKLANVRHCKGGEHPFCKEDWPESETKMSAGTKKIASPSALTHRIGIRQIPANERVRMASQLIATPQIYMKSMAF